MDFSFTVYRYDALFSAGLLDTKCAVKDPASCSNEAMEPAGSWLNDVLATPFSVVAKVLHQIASEKPCNCMTD